MFRSEGIGKVKALSGNKRFSGTPKNAATPGGSPIGANISQLDTKYLDDPPPPGME